MFRYPYPIDLILSISSWLALVHLMNYVVDYIYTLALPVIAVKVLGELVLFGFSIISIGTDALCDAFFIVRTGEQIE